MKNWFINLDDKYKKLIHLIMGLAFIIIPSCSGEKPSSFIYILWLSVIVFETIFIVWHVKYKKKPTKNIENNQSYIINDKGNNDTLKNITEKQTIIKETKPIITTNKVTFCYPLNKTYFFVDVETADSHNDTICAIGTIIIKNGEEKRFYSLIDPKVHITNTSIHGIGDDDVIGEPTLDKFWNTISNYLDNDYVIVGHNVSFDISVLAKDLERYNIEFNPIKKVDTMTIAKDIYYNYKTQCGDLKLDTLCNRLNIDINHHNAESDITATKQVLEILLSSANRNIDEFINVHYSSAKTVIINNVKNVRTYTYWDDIEIGRTPVYFTNWNKINVDFTPEYDKVNIEDLIYTSMMNRENCSIKRIVKQVKLIKDFVVSLGGKCFNKGSKTAKSYIEYYYMDIQEYQKLRSQGYKIFHAIEVEEFINNNQDEINNYIATKQQEQLEKLKQEEQIKKEKEEKKLQRKIEEEKRNEKVESNRKLVQMTDDGTIIKVYNKLADAIRETGINSKSIRDCCNGKQKHAGNFVWKYIEENQDSQSN